MYENFQWHHPIYLLPVLTLEDGKTKVCQALAIVRYIGKLTNFGLEYIKEKDRFAKGGMISESEKRTFIKHAQNYFKDFYDDLNQEVQELKFTDLEMIFKDLKSLFEKRGYIINWKSLQNQSLDETINALAMASPFSLEEKQVLLEALNLAVRKNKIAEILNTYSYDEYNNTTLQ